MASESDDTKKPRAESDVDPATTVSVSVDEIPDAHPATPPSEPLPELPAAAEPPASASGSVDVKLSNPELGPPAIPESVTPAESQPISTSGGVVAAIASASEGTGPARRSRRITGLVQDAVSAGVERLGAGIETVGEGVTKVGDLTKKVPLVGSSVGKLGEGLSKAGESIHALPRVAQTRRGRLLVRSVVVGFLLVFSWIVVIVGFQLRQHDTPDLRPAAEQILVQISLGRPAIENVYDRASPHFWELESRERFIDDMNDLNLTNGRFREITAINEMLVTTGRGGRNARVSLTASYENGIAHGSISFNYESGEWKLLGIAIEVPRNVRITEAKREERVAACFENGHDFSYDRAKCTVRDAFETILENIRDGKAAEVYEQASRIFKDQETLPRFIQVQEDTRAAIGNYKRVLNVTEAKSIGGITATFDAVVEFERASGVRVTADFSRCDDVDCKKVTKNDKWKLRRFKIVVPMPRVEDEPGGPALVPPAPEMPATLDGGLTR